MGILSFFLSQGFGNEIVMDGIGGVGFGILCCAMEEGRESRLGSSCPSLCWLG